MKEDWASSILQLKSRLACSNRIISIQYKVHIVLRSSVFSAKPFTQLSNSPKEILFKRLCTPLNLKYGNVNTEKTIAKDEDALVLIRYLTGFCIFFFVPVRTRSLNQIHVWVFLYYLRFERHSLVPLMLLFCSNWWTMSECCLPFFQAHPLGSTSQSDSQVPSDVVGKSLNLQTWRLP